MNLSQIMASALPELPPQQRPDRPPRIHPQLVTCEHVERDGVYVRAIIPKGPPHYFRMSMFQYSVASLFNGNRTYEEVARLCATKLGASLSVEEVRQFADALEKEEFWYRTPQEESEVLAHELAEQRHRAIKRKHAHVDPTTIELWHFNPSKMLDWLYARLKWMYSPWFTAWSLFMIGIMVVILGSQWRSVWGDTLYFYNLTGQPLWHVFEFFGVFLVLGAFHEAAHGMSCHHYGGKSHRMGFFLMYLMPGVFCDCAEAFVRAGRWGRIVTVAAGVWAEIVICSYLTVVWWMTPPGSAIHNLVYIFILSGAMFALIINWNPLSRMDGYFIFCEIFRFHDLKGQSTSYVINVLRKYVFRLPAAVPAMSPLRRIGFTAYALLSGAYCYFLLGALCRITYHVLYFYWPMWAFLPAWALALLIFRSRIRKFVKFLKELYLDKREVMKKNWKPLAAAAAAVFILLLLPLRRESVQQKFLLGPVQRAVVRNEVPGRVMEVMAEEGQHVKAGATLVRMTDLDLASDAAKADMEYRMASARSTDAALRYTDFGAAEQQRMRAASDYRVAHERERKLQLVTPISGVVVTPRVRELVGSYLSAGTKLTEIADTSTMRARVFVPELEMYKLQVVSGNALHIDGLWGTFHGQVVSVSTSSRELAPGLEAASKYEGVRLPAFFAVDILIPNEGDKLRDGMTGVAKIYGRRRSILAMALEPVVEALAHRLW